MALAYTEDSEWRNRGEFLKGREAIRDVRSTQLRLLVYCYLGCFAASALFEFCCLCMYDHVGGFQTDAAFGLTIGMTFQAHGGQLHSMQACRTPAQCALQIKKPQRSTTPFHLLMPVLMLP